MNYRIEIQIRPARPWHALLAPTPGQPSGQAIWEERDHTMEEFNDWLDHDWDEGCKVEQAFLSEESQMAPGERQHGFVSPSGPWLILRVEVPQVSPPVGEGPQAPSEPA